MICSKCGWPVYESINGLRCCRNLSCPNGQLRQAVQAVRDEKASTALPWLIFAAISAILILFLILF